jgi:hypothetical protein
MMRIYSEKCLCYTFQQDMGRKDDVGMASIQNDRELEFAIFCVENIAIRLGTDAEKVYDALTLKSDILSSYIVPCFDILHTQDKDYIIDDILDVMKERGLVI